MFHVEHFVPPAQSGQCSSKWAKIDREVASLAP